MSDFRLFQVTALGGAQPRDEQIGELRIRENDNVALASLAARAGRLAVVQEASRQYLGHDLPGPQSMTLTQPIRAWWAGPEQWLFEAPLASHELLADELKQPFGDHASVTEQTGGWCAFEITGPTCIDVFERLCNVDIRALKSGAAVRSSIEHMSCFVLCNQPGQSYSIRGPGSSAVSLYEALLDAARSIA